MTRPDQLRMLAQSAIDRGEGVGNYHHLAVIQAIDTAEAEARAESSAEMERLRRIEHSARDVDGAWYPASKKDGAPLLWVAEAGEVLADLRAALERLPDETADPDAALREALTRLVEDWRSVPRNGFDEEGRIRHEIEEDCADRVDELLAIEAERDIP